MRTGRSNLIFAGDPRAASSSSKQPMLDGFGTLHYLLASAGRRELGQDKGQQWHDLSATLYSENTELQSRRTKRKKKRAEFVFGKHNLGGEGPLPLSQERGDAFSPPLRPSLRRFQSLCPSYSVFLFGGWRGGPRKDLTRMPMRRGGLPPRRRPIFVLPRLSSPLPLPRCIQDRPTKRLFGTLLL